MGRKCMRKSYDAIGATRINKIISSRRKRDIKGCRLITLKNK